MVERAARVLLFICVALVVAALFCGCTMHDVQYPFGEKSSRPRAAAEPPEDIEINVNTAAKPAAPAPAAVAAPMVPASSGTAWLGETPAIPAATIKGAPRDVPAPELENVNRYARALEAKLRQRYNNTPAFAGRVGRVQLLPVGEPQVSLDGRKLRMEWSQIVFDEWGQRLPELEKEYYVVTFGDGKPQMQRTRPSITVGLNNEGGYGEFAPVRGGRLSARPTAGSPEMFDRPHSARVGLLDDNLAARDSAPGGYDFMDLPTIAETLRDSEAIKDAAVASVPVIAPAGESLSAVVVNE